MSCTFLPSKTIIHGYTKEGIRMAVATAQHVLSDDILTRCAERAPVYDRENRFFTEDFEELRDAGYLLMNVPEELGGMGLSLAEVCQEQRRLAYHAAPTALAVNMHLYWTGVAAEPLALWGQVLGMAPEGRSGR
jgi:alkylation response protein AidB-like acyl-CoA dehydrogenase